MIKQWIDSNLELVPLDQELSPSKDQGILKDPWADREIGWRNRNYWDVPNQNLLICPSLWDLDMHIRASQRVNEILSLWLAVVFDNHWTSGRRLVVLNIRVLEKLKHTRDSVWELIKPGSAWFYWLYFYDIVWDNWLALNHPNIKKSVVDFVDKYLIVRLKILWFDVRVEYEFWDYFINWRFLINNDMFKWTIRLNYFSIKDWAYLKACISSNDSYIVIKALKWFSENEVVGK